MSESHHRLKIGNALTMNFIDGTFYFHSKGDPLTAEDAEYLAHTINLLLIELRHANMMATWAAFKVRFGTAENVNITTEPSMTDLLLDSFTRLGFTQDATP